MNLEFNYDEALATVEKIKVLATELQSTLNSVDSSVEANINNPSVWAGESANAYAKKWNAFSEEFPMFVQEVNSSSERVKLALDSYHRGEQNSTM